MISANFISNIHWIPVIVLLVFSFILGALWHTPFLFGKIWEKENKLDKVVSKANAPFIFIGTALMHFVAIAALSAVVSGKGSINGLITGFFISMVWIVPTMTGTYLFANRPFKLLAVDSGMYVVLFSVSGLVLGIW